MKQLTILFLLFSFFAQGQITIRSGNTIARRMPSITVFDVTDYGAKEEYSAAVNTPYIQAAINACEAVGGGYVYVPGIFWTNQLESYTTVTLKGDGRRTSKLRTNADTLIAIHNLDDALAGVPFEDIATTLIEDLFLDGDSVSKVGLYVDRAANFEIKNTVFWKFRSRGLWLRNSLIGSVNNCTFKYNLTGIYGSADGTNNTASTMVNINRCVVYYAKKWGMEWSGGGQIKIEDTDFSANGSSGDTTTGAIYYRNNTWPKGLTIIGGWMEQNFGTEVWIASNGANGGTPLQNYPATTTHEIYSPNQQGHNYSFTSRSIYISGSSQRLHIFGGNVFGAASGKNIVLDGANNTVKTYGTAFDNAPGNVIRGTGNTITNN